MQSVILGRSAHVSTRSGFSGVLVVRPCRRKAICRAFPDRFSGEWEGALATFDGEGKAEQLPAWVVPPQYRDWDVQVGMPHRNLRALMQGAGRHQPLIAGAVQVYDWQTRVSTSAEGEKATLRLIKLLPTAGCDPEEKASEDAW